MCSLNNTNTNKNIFKQQSYLHDKPSNDVQFELNLSQFPCIVNNVNIIESSLNYKEASKTHLNNPTNTTNTTNLTNLKPGWISYQYKSTEKKNGLTLINRNLCDLEIVENNLDTNSCEHDGNIILNKLVDNWKIYKDQYDENYGKGEYDAYYKNDNISRYDCNCYVDCECEYYEETE